MNRTSEAAIWRPSSGSDRAVDASRCWMEWWISRSSRPSSPARGSQAAESITSLRTRLRCRSVKELVAEARSAPGGGGGEGVDDVQRDVAGVLDEFLAHASSGCCSYCLAGRPSRRRRCWLASSCVGVVPDHQARHAPGKLQQPLSRDHYHRRRRSRLHARRQPRTFRVALSRF